MRKKHVWTAWSVFLVLFLASASAGVLAQGEEGLRVEKVTGDVYCLSGGGGNIGILKAEDGLLVVDASYARLASSVLEEIGKVSPGRIRILINTHYHADHTGGNLALGKDARVILHENCRTSYLASLKPEEKSEAQVLHLEVYEKEMNLEVGDENVKLLHFGPGHTAGDTVVVFEKARVVHAGDLFFHGMPPYIDVKDGSDTKNWIATIETLAKTYPDFKVIPGHGEVTTMKAFLRFAGYLKALRERVAAAIREGKTREEAQESVDLSDFPDIQDRGEFLTKKENIGWVYDEMTRK
ncbi:MAG: MBL fold metallo-hydrolase [Candidatus Aminicenantales bacterium]